ncbi:MAG: hypothetical protein U0793_04200 [Gemmataceae bacterium]
MIARSRLTIAALLLLAAPAVSWAQRPKDILWTHAFDLAARKVGEAEFTKTTQKYGVEAFKDTNNGLGVYISEKGSLAAAHGFDKIKAGEKSKGPDWLTGLDLPARKAGEKEFTKDTKVFPLEVFKDSNTDNWIYITGGRDGAAGAPEKGLIASCPVTLKTTTSNQAPKWVHSFDLNVRKGGVKEWKDATKIGVEVYYDANTGNLVYITETGAIAVIPSEGAAEPVKGAGKAPEWLHGLDLACRKSKETNFTKDTKRFGVEVFHDANNGNIVLMCETGAIAVVKGAKDTKAPTSMVKQPTWQHGLNLKARVFGEAEFSDTTRVWGAECFRDDNLGITIYIGEEGSLTAIK